MDSLRMDLEMTESRKKSLTAIISEKTDQIRGFIRKRVRNISMADDLLQDVFVQLVNVYEDIESMDAWLFTVARNKVNDYYRKKRPEYLEEIYPNDGEENSESLQNLIPDLSDGPEQLYLRDLIWEELMTRLGELPDEQREAFEMHELNNFSIKDIAEFQGVTVNTVLSRKRYAVIALKASLEEFYNENFKNL